MQFNSIEFSIFLFISILVLRLINHKKFFRITLTLLSWFFYSFFNFKLLIIIILFTSSTWYIACLIKKYQKYSQIIFIFGITILLAQLAFFKYSGWLIDILNFLSDYNLSFKILLPIGISFYTFQALSYIVDLKNGKAFDFKCFWHFSAFISFFPQLVAGPIERSNNLAPQLINKKFVSQRMVNTGVVIVCVAILKKVILADNLGGTANYLNNNLDVINGASILILFAFAFQIYFDFSAYSEIALGSARMLGIRLSRNFRQPYFSSTPQEFWERWHITLSFWIRDYVFIPLVKRTKYYFAILIAFCLSGMWHGAGFTFLIWGLWNGFLIILYHFCKKNFNSYKFPKIISGIIYFILTMIGWLFFYAQDYNNFINILSNFINFLYQPENIDYFFKVLAYIIILICPVMLIEIYSKGKRSLIDWAIVKIKPTVVFFILFYFIVEIFYRRQGNEFIYFQF